MSRFAVSYGMVLNLLRGRSLSQVQGVVNASFGNFLRSLARSARGARLESMTAELGLLRANMSPKTREAERALLLMTKLRGRLQEERRALRMLQQQLAEDPRGDGLGGDASVSCLVTKPLPVPVLIRVAKGGAARASASQAQPPGWGELRVDAADGGGGDDDSDVMDGDADDFDEALDDLAGVSLFSGPRVARVEDEIDAVGEVVLSAAILAFERVSAADDSFASGGGGWEFTALGADNTWYRGPLELVVGVGDSWLLSPGEVAATPPPSSQASAWTWRAGTARAAGNRTSFPSAGRIANALVGLSEGDGMPALAADDVAAAFLSEARERIAKLERQLAALVSDKALQKTIQKAATRINRIRQLEASVQRLGRRQEEAVPAGWGEFTSAFAVLRALGALRGEETPELTRLGEAAMSVRAQNELWVVSLMRTPQPIVCFAADANFAARCAGHGAVERRPGRARGAFARWRGDCAAQRGVRKQTECLRCVPPVGGSGRRLGAACAAGRAAGERSAAGVLRRTHLAFATVRGPGGVLGSGFRLVRLGMLVLTLHRASRAPRRCRAQVCADTSLDEGDVARLLRRIAEFLGQVADVPHTSSTLRTASKHARRMVDRPPISELVPGGAGA